MPKLKLPKKSSGRPTKYAVGLLNVGQQMTFEWPSNILSMKQSIEAYARRHGTRYEMKDTHAGLVVRRVI